MPDYTQADLAEARTLAPELGTKAQERIARALAQRTGPSSHLEPYSDREFARALEQLKRRNPIAGRAFAAGVERLQRERDAALHDARSLAFLAVPHVESDMDLIRAYSAKPGELLDHG